ncbi:MAG: hypothetical protein KGJ78_08270 [Alphaproteobacteria bacterium]|nr:hypothetical protein [Alphaproteobacteria bacterium]
MAWDAGRFPAAQFCRRHRTVFLSIALALIGVVAGAAAALSILQNAAPRDALVVTAGVVLAAAFGLIQTRHLSLAFLMAAAPLPGLVCAAPMSDGGAFGAVPLVAYAFAFGAAVLEGGSVLGRILGRPSCSPQRPIVVALGLMAALAALWFWQDVQREAATQSVLDTVLATGSSLFVMRIGASFLVFDEAFITRANRASERRQRVLERVSSFAAPRWGLSFTGIGLVFLALGWFGALPDGIEGATLLRGAVSAGIMLAAAAVFGGWRDGIALALAGLTVALIVVWCARGTSLAGVAALQIAMFAALLAFLGSRSTRSAAKRGCNGGNAHAVGMEDAGEGQFFAAAGAVVAVLPAVVLAGSGAYPAGFAYAGLAAVVFVPAFSMSLEILYPPRHTAEELYSRR